MSPFLRQVLVAVSPQLAAFAVGGAITYPSILLQQFKAKDSLLQLDLDTSSWIGSIHGLSGIPSILMPAVMQWKGRRIAFIVSCLISIIGWIVAYTSSSVAQILVSESFHGLGTHCILCTSLLSISEMVAPKFRNVSLVSFYFVQAFGIAFVGIIAMHLHWKTISMIMCIPITIAFLIACMWPESPSWLAYKGKFDECEKAFLLLRGSDDASKQELQNMIKAHKNNIARNKNVGKHTVRNIWNTVKRRDFYIPCLLTILLLNLMYWSGTLVVLIYYADIIYKTSGSIDMGPIGGVIINSILFIGITITSVLVRYFNNKSVLLFSVVGTAFSLVAAFISTYLQSVNVLPRDSFACLYCLFAFMIANSFGINSIVFSLAAEIMPVKHRGLGGALFVISTCILHSSSLKLAPYLFLSINMYRTFLLYAANAIICGLLVWRYVPETKGRTLQEIEDFYNLSNMNSDDKIHDVVRPLTGP